MPLNSIEDMQEHIKEHIAPRLRTVMATIAEEVARKNSSVSYKLYESTVAPRLWSQIGLFLKPDSVTREMREEVLFYAACRWEPGSLECWVTLGGEAPGDLDWDDTAGPRSRINVDQDPSSMKAELDAWLTSAAGFILSHKNAVISHLTSHSEVADAS